MTDSSPHGPLTRPMQTALNHLLQAPQGKLFAVLGMGRSGAAMAAWL